MKREVPFKHIKELRRQYLGEWMANLYEYLMTFGIFQLVSGHTTSSVHPIVGDHEPDAIDYEKEYQIETFWYDVFIYLLDVPYVEDGAILAFFSDKVPENTEKSICYK